MSNLGHNERSYRLDTLANEARKGLEGVAQGEKFTLAGWLAYGAALNEGRALFPGDREFGQWLEKTVLSSNLDKEPHPGEQQAAMWAAANSEQFAEAQAAGKAGTVRGIHAKWKEIEAEREAERLAEEKRLRDEAEKAASNADQVGSSRVDEPSIVHKASDTSGADNAGISVANDAVDGPATAQKPDAPDPHAKLRAEYRKLTDEAREDDWIALRLENKEARDRIASQSSQIADLKQTVKDLSVGSDLGAKVSRLMEQLGAAKFTRDEAMRSAKAMEYRLKLAEKRAAQAEEIEIPYA